MTGLLSGGPRLLIFASISNTEGAPSFAHFAKGGSRECLRGWVDSWGLAQPFHCKFTWVPRPCRCVFCSDRACPELVEGAGILTSSSARRRSRFPLTSPHNREDTIPCSNSSLKTEYRMANSFGDKILPVSPGRSIVYSHFQSPQKLLP